MNKIIFILLTALSISVFCQDNIKKAPSFRLENTEGFYVELDSITAKGPVLINFWASWCKPCREELPEFYKISEEFSEKGLKVLLITIDKPNDINAKSFLKTKGIDLEMLKDCDMNVFKSFGGGSSVPYTFLIDSMKNVVFRKKGQTSYEELNSELKKLFK
jgi:peroxiredoxin